VVVFDRDVWLADGVRIVDTPGTGSIHGLSTQAAYQYLDEADAVVLVLAADQPIGDEERRLLESVRSVTDRVRTPRARCCLAATRSCFVYRVPSRSASPAKWLAELMEKRIAQNLAGIRCDWMQRLNDAQWQLEAASRRQLETVARIMSDALGRARELGGADRPRRITREGELVSLLHQIDDIQEILRVGPGERSP